MPQVTHQEEEAKDKVRCRQPLTGVHEVHRVDLGDDPPTELIDALGA
jgi:hypothetical protein